ncbi:MAG: glycosyltransferase [Desulfobacteraceae bacterium]|nr:glycosyltransferase [Desulfobacteraceae bacterium]
MDKSQIKNCLVSIVIPSYNSEDTIEKTLVNLSNQNGEIKYEIIVVNSSDDATFSIIKEKFPWVNLVQLPEKALPGTARNTGVRSAKGKFIAFLDSDCLVENNWLAKMLKHYSPEFCAVGGPIDNANPENLIGLAGYILEFSEFVSGEKRVVDHIPSGNIMLLKTTFDESGGFAEEFRYAQEDRLFSWKLRKQTGRNLLFHPEIRVKHIHRVKFSDYLKHQRSIGRGGAEILKATDIRGSNLMNNRLLINLILPLAALKKLLLSGFLVLKQEPLKIIKKPLVIPVLCAGAFSWMSGFAEQANFSFKAEKESD